MGETDPRVEIVARAMCEAGDLDPDERMANDGPRWRYYVPHASVILAALDAARPADPSDPPDVGLYMSGNGRFYDEGGAEWEITQADYERLTENCQCSHCVARRSARPDEPLQEYDATDAIDRAIRNWSTISDEPPVDEDVAGLVERLRTGVTPVRGTYVTTVVTRIHIEAADLIERLLADNARLTKERDEFAEAVVEYGAMHSPDGMETLAKDRDKWFARATAAEAEVADLRARLATAVDGVVREIAAERQRQVAEEGWTPDHDDRHADGAIARAAAAYAIQSAEYPIIRAIRSRALEWWPWDMSWWKPKGRRRDLVRAAALIVAEIERLDRTALASIQGART